MSRSSVRTHLPSTRRVSLQGYSCSCAASLLRHAAQGPETGCGEPQLANFWRPGVRVIPNRGHAAELRPELWRCDDHLCKLRVQRKFRHGISNLFRRGAAQRPVRCVKGSQLPQVLSLCEAVTCEAAALVERTRTGARKQCS